ncbi:Protein phosphatase 1 regulatory subunit SDS22 [Serendipita indica DSM 11827]|uniref:Probable SDS22-protein phosphatase 1, regulatory subunit 7 n=1 Tax=Serendipita indica (strain DSM 11827) TaxID=1109443 RepID=G4TKQ2_SERID|nr:Protein phosphatase 1 regulatory subunit SDS22 [Serendipita indica DSM 11827]CCA71895.1 probable SDS22-protein phosphatase 1, regulatory subunit 7 [Serendipita indica DSM 11827]
MSTSNNEKQARLVLVSDDDDDETQQHDEEPATLDDLLAQLPDDTEEIDLARSRLASCSHLGIPRFANHLRSICLRANFLTDLESDVFGPLVHLEEADFYDNRLKQLGNALDGKASLRILDLSFNLLRAVPPELVNIPALQTIYFVQNKITRIEHFHHLGATLRSLELGSNRIRVIENLDALVNLEELWLGKNKITKLENLDKLVKLRLLSIQSNRITRIEGLEKLVNLEELYMSHNGLEKIEGLENNVKLTTLDVGNNMITAVENVSHLSDLQEFWASYNQIADIKTIDKELGGLAKLETVYLEGNPAQRTDMANYRRRLIIALPQLKQIDATLVKV